MDKELVRWSQPGCCDQWLFVQVETSDELYPLGSILDEKAGHEPKVCACVLENHIYPGLQGEALVKHWNRLPREVVDSILERTGY